MVWEAGVLTGGQHPHMALSINHVGANTTTTTRQHTLSLRRYYSPDSTHLTGGRAGLSGLMDLIYPARSILNRVIKYAM